MIKQGEVAFVKTTGEAVYILHVAKPDPLTQYDKATVRRPKAGNNGIVHVIEDFHVEELETLDEQRARFMSERSEMMKQYGPKEDSPSSFLA